MMLHVMIILAVHFLKRCIIFQATTNDTYHIMMNASFGFLQMVYSVNIQVEYIHDTFYVIFC